MLTKVFKILAVLFSIILPSQAFWWRTSSTEAPPPPPPVMKQIPLTYFRTYTYQQPLTSNQLPLPLLSSTDYITNYNALNNAPYFNPMMQMPVVPMSMSMSNDIPMDPTPIKRYGNINMVRSLGPLPAETTTTPEPTTTTTSTTTTTTTTPKPTTTTTTEPSTTMPAEVSSTSLPVLASDSLDNIETTFPAFNRKAFTNHFNINYNRPVYPYPEYSVSKSNTLNEKYQSSTQNIEFVPCMCPVNIPNGGFPSGYQSGVPIVGNPSNSIFLAQGRTNVEAEASLDVPLAQVTEIKAVEENTNLTDDLKNVNLNENGEEVTSAQTL